MALGVSQTGTMTSTTEKKLPPWLEQAFQGATGSATDYFSGYSSAPQTSQGLQGMTNLAQNPGQIPGFNQTLSNFSGLMGGDYLHGGAGFNAAMDAAQANIQPRVQSAFNQSGRMGGGLAQEAMSTGLANAFAGLYDNERGRQMQGLQMAPQMQDYAFSPSAKLYDIGQLYDNEAESNLDDYIRRLTGVGSVAGASTTESQPLFENKLAELLGLGTAGAGLISALFGGGSGGSGGGGGVGGALSGLGSLFGLTGDGGALSSLGSLFGFGSDAADIGGATGSANIGDILGGGSGSGGGAGGALPPTPPGAGQSAFDALFGGGSGGSDLSVIGGIGNTQPGASANVGSILAGGGSPLAGGLGALATWGPALDAAGLGGISSLFGGGGFGIAPGAANIGSIGSATLADFGLAGLGSAAAPTTGLAAGGGAIGTGGAGAGGAASAAGGSLSGLAGAAIPLAGFAALGSAIMGAQGEKAQRDKVSQGIFDAIGLKNDAVNINGEVVPLELQGALINNNTQRYQDGSLVPYNGTNETGIQGQGRWKVPGQDRWLEWDRLTGALSLVPWSQTQIGRQQAQQAAAREQAQQQAAAQAAYAASQAAAGSYAQEAAPIPPPPPAAVVPQQPVYIAPNTSGEDYSNQGYILNPFYDPNNVEMH